MLITELKSVGVILQKENSNKIYVDLNGDKKIQEKELVPDLDGNGTITSREVLEFLVNNVSSMPIIDRAERALVDSDEVPEIKNALLAEYLTGFYRARIKIQYALCEAYWGAVTKYSSNDAKRIKQQVVSNYSCLGDQAFQLALKLRSSIGDDLAVMNYHIKRSIQDQVVFYDPSIENNSAAAYEDFIYNYNFVYNNQLISQYNRPAGMPLVQSFTTNELNPLIREFLPPLQVKVSIQTNKTMTVAPVKATNVPVVKTVDAPVKASKKK